MQLLHPTGHRPLDALNLDATVEQAALQSEHGLLALLVDDCADDEQAVRFAGAGVPWSIAAADDNLRWGLFNDLKMIGELRAGLVG